MTQPANQEDHSIAAELAGTADEMLVLRSENAVLRERVTRQNEAIGALEARILDLERAGSVSTAATAASRHPATG
jgi:hypothetical protein